MIYYNKTLMPELQDAILYMATNPVAFTSFNDHNAAIYIGLHELVERSKQTCDDPIVLIEQYLDCIYTADESTDAIAAFIMQTPQMITAMTILKQNWVQFAAADTTESDALLPAASKIPDDIIMLYSEISLRLYLETLAMIYNERD